MSMDLLLLSCPLQHPFYKRVDDQIIQELDLLLFLLVLLATGRDLEFSVVGLPGRPT